jgi:hypothetical protein
MCKGLGGAVVPPWFSLPARGKIVISQLILVMSDYGEDDRTCVATMASLSGMGLLASSGPPCP